MASVEEVRQVMTGVADRLGEALDAERRRPSSQPSYAGTIAALSYALGALDVYAACPQTPEPPAGAPALTDQDVCEACARLEPCPGHPAGMAVTDP